MADYAIIVQANSDNNLRAFLISYFSECGNITSIAIVPDKTDFSRNLAVVQFEHTRGVEIAINFDKSLYGEKPILINRARANFVCPPKSGVFPKKPNAENLTLEDAVRSLSHLKYDVPESLLEKYCPDSLKGEATVETSSTTTTSTPSQSKAKTYVAIDDDSAITGPFSPSTMVDSNLPYDISYRVILIGDSGVGKTNIMGRWAKDNYSSETQSTITIECKSRAYMVDGKVINVQIWDTAGQERFRSLASQYYRKADGVVVVYDMTRISSFDSIKGWLDQVEQFTGSPEENLIQYLLIGNKKDLVEERVIRQDEALSFAKTKNMAFMETSAVEGTNCMKALQIIMQDIHEIQTKRRKATESTNSSSTISISQSEKIEAEKKDDSCC
jgi:Ras-related protein Rab-11A